MSICSIGSIFNRLSLNTSVKLGILSRGISTNTALPFKVTPILLGEPLKKKKRLDPSVIKARDERRKRKLEKQIRKLEKNAKQLKPIEECEVPLHVLEDKLKRSRNVQLSEAVIEQRILLEKQWCLFKHQQHLADIQLLDKITYSQQKALDQLKIASEELYEAALQLDETLLPFNSDGPKETPPNDKYETFDGDSKDISRVW